MIGLVGENHVWRNHAGREMNPQMRKLNHNLILLAAFVLLVGIFIWIIFSNSQSAKITQFQTFQIQSEEWCIGEEVEMTLITNPSHAGKFISLTLLASDQA